MHPLIELYARRSDENDIGLIDLRDSEAFGRQHICGSLHIDGLDGLRHRFSWLPPPRTDSRPGKELIVICRDQDRAELNQLLSRWDVKAFVDGNDEQFWSDAAKAQVQGGPFREDCPPLLFEPSPILEDALQAVEKSHSNTQHAQLTILDLGMGAGRDLAWTVNRKSAFTWLATGIDNLLHVVERAKLLQRDYRFDQKGKSQIERLLWAQATEDGSLQALRLIQGSKSRGTSDELYNSLEEFAASHLPRQRYDLILFVRFYPKELIKKINALTHDKSVIAISHFTTLSTEPDYISPDGSKRFEEHHIAEILGSWGQDWTSVYHTIHRSEDDRPLRSVLFQRNDLHDDYC